MFGVKKRICMSLGGDLQVVMVVVRCRKEAFWGMSAILTPEFKERKATYSMVGGLSMA